MKHILTKPVIAGILGAVCLAVIMAYTIFRGGQQPEFVPDSVAPPTTIDSWTENTSPSPATVNAESGAYAFNHPTAGRASEQGGVFPRVAEVNDDVIVIHFTDPNPPCEPPPEVPGTDPSILYNDRNNPPLVTEPATTGRNPQGTGVSGAPVHGSTNERGEVYDLAFGWVLPGRVVQIEIHNDGDLNKMVGNMR
jgi:hypothetical protein